MHFNQNISSGKFTNAILSVMALAWAFVSCVQIEENNQGIGYLSFSPVSVDCSVENLVPTKAAVPSEDMPQGSDFTVTISGGSLEAPIVYEPGNLPSGQIPFVVGTYTVEATYGANDFGQAYFHASRTFELDVNEVETVELTDIPLGNSMVAVTLPDEFYDHMSVDAIVLKDASGNSVEMEAGQYEYAPSGREVWVTFSGTNSVGQYKEIEISLGVLEPQHAYDVECNLDLPVLTFPDQSKGAIAGNLYLTSLAGGTGIDASKIIYQISADGGYTWDKVTPVSVNGYWRVNYDGTKLDPAKTYQIRAAYGAVVTEPWAFTPSDFTVTSYAETSYSRYQNKLSSANDAGTGDKVMNISGEVSLSADVLATYSGLVGGVKFIYDTTELPASMSGKTFSPDSGTEMTGQSWGRHTLNAIFTFDGTGYESSALDCHVTGIPFRAAPPKGDGNTAWDRDGGGSWNSDYAKLSSGGGEASITSPSFYVPADISVNVSVKATANPDKATRGTTFTLYLGNVSLFSATAKDMSWFVYYSEDVEGTKEAIVTSENNYIRCHNSYGLGLTCSYVYYVNVLYRL